MARSRRPARSRGGRGRQEEAVEAVAAQEVVPLEFAEPERPGRAARGRSSGGGGGGIGSYIGILVPLAVTITAVLIILIGGFMLKASAEKGMSSVMDEVGVNAALALAVVEPEWWQTDHGLTKSLLDAFKAKRDERKKDAQKDPDWDERDNTVIDNDYKEVVETWDLSASDMEKVQDQVIIDANQKRLEVLVNRQKMPGSTFLYAGILDAGGTTFRYSGRQPTLQTAGQRKIGNVTVIKVLADTQEFGRRPGRLYRAPITDKFKQSGGEARVILDETPVRQAGAGLMTTVLILVLVGLVVVGAVAFGLCVTASKALMGVQAGVEQVARGDLDARVPTRGPGEAGAIGRSVDRAMKTFRNVQAQSIEAASAAPVMVAAEPGMEAEGLLPSEPPRVDGYEFEAVHKATAEGANDFYDYIRVDDTHFGIVIADMPHTGPKGTFAAATFRALMRAYAPGETSPAKVLSQVNRVMAGELKRGDHITAMYTVLDTEKGIVAVASAGHLPLIFWKLEKKGSALLNPEGIAIGLDKGPVFEKTVVDKRIKLEKGDRIVLYTDGPVAAANTEGEEFGEQRFYYLVSREAPKNSAAFVNFVANEVDLFHEGAPQQDDITLVTVRKLS